MCPGARALGGPGGRARTLGKEDTRSVNDTLKRLRDAVVQRDREVEVGPDGEVRETTSGNDLAGSTKPEKATKLSARTFGTR